MVLLRYLLGAGGAFEMRLFRFVHCFCHAFTFLFEASLNRKSTGPGMGAASNMLFWLCVSGAIEVHVLGCA